VLTLPAETPAVPEDLIAYGQANAIESILLAVYAAVIALEQYKKTLIENTAAAWYYAGEIYGGEI